MWDLSFCPGIEPAPPALEGEVLTTGPPGKSLSFVLNSANLLSKKCLIVILIYILKVINETIEDLLTCLLAVRISSVNHLFMFIAHLSTGVE